jgi:hypothetical protein
MDPQAAHHIGQRELVQHGFARVSLVREARGLDVRDRELDGHEVNGVVVTAIGPRTHRILAIEDVAVDAGPGDAELDIRLGAVMSRVHRGLGLLAARFEEEALC